MRRFWCCSRFTGLFNFRHGNSKNGFLISNFLKLPALRYQSVPCGYILHPFLWSRGTLGILACWRRSSWKFRCNRRWKEKQKDDEWWLNLTFPCQSTTEAMRGKYDTMTQSWGLQSSRFWTKRDVPGVIVFLAIKIDWLFLPVVITFLDPLFEPLAFDGVVPIVAARKTKTVTAFTLHRFWVRVGNLKKRVLVEFTWFSF